MGYGYGPGWGMMGGWGGYGGYGYGPLHLIVWIVIIVAIIAFCAWMMRSMCMPGMRRHMPPGRSSGLDVLEERYARGEINRDEYLQKKKDIGG
jgi:putative membrane protein